MLRVAGRSAVIGPLRHGARYGCCPQGRMPANEPVGDKLSHPGDANTCSRSTDQLTELLNNAP
jgi:hypothetical protein